ncbi:YciI family protein [Gilvimarinus agarilyticus]|uniref:YciI family protein n=1 Tax=Gilvimarinus agarilyticus TaxID=679259 RepID=UPI0005A2EEBE|nr:YciI family protein [Gilvimarinus agarilyticus]
MQFFIIMPASPATEAGVMPGTELLQAMGEFNQQLAAAGVLVSGNGLHPTSRSARVNFTDSGAAIEPGPFTFTPNTIAGYWVWELPSLQAACDWAAKIPSPSGQHYSVEIRPILGPDDFGEALTPDLRQQEESLRQRLTLRS